MTNREFIANFIANNPEIFESFRVSRSRRCIIAKTLRDARIVELEGINFRVKPTKGIDSGAGGKKKELALTRNTTAKAKTAGAEEVDNYMNFEGHAQPIEIKTNSGEITTILERLAKGKDGFIVYSLEMNNSNTSFKWRIVPDLIMKMSTFVEIATDCGCIRTKKTTRGTMTVSLEASSKKWYNALNEYMENTGLIYNKDLRYERDMFEGL